MSILEKILIIGNIAKDLSDSVLKAESNGVWVRTKAFEEISAGVKDFEYDWYGNCMNKAFIKDGIRLYTIYNDNEVGYEPKPQLSDEAYKAFDAQ